MRQVVTISPTGVVAGLQHKKGKGFDLRSLGAATIVRASEVVWNDTEQAWFVELREGAGTYNGRVLTYDLLACTLPPSHAVFHTVRGFTEYNGLALFDDYDDAVKAEIAVLDALRLAGLLV